MWVLGTECVSFIRAVSVLNLYTISQPPNIALLTLLLLIHQLFIINRTLLVKAHTLF